MAEALASFRAGLAAEHRASFRDFQRQLVEQEMSNAIAGSLVRIRENFSENLVQHKPLIAPHPVAPAVGDPAFPISSAGPFPGPIPAQDDGIWDEVQEIILIVHRHNPGNLSKLAACLDRAQNQSGVFLGFRNLLGQVRGKYLGQKGAAAAAARQHYLSPAGVAVKPQELSPIPHLTLQAIQEIACIRSKGAIPNLTSFARDFRIAQSHPFGPLHGFQSLLESCRAFESSVDDGEKSNLGKGDKGGKVPRDPACIQ